MSPGSDRFPHLYFDIGGAENDVSAFWNDVWSDAERRGVSMASLVGMEGSMTSPARFFLENLVGANTLYVVVDDSQLDDVSMMHDPMFFDMLTKVVPSAIRLFVIEHRSVSGEDYMDLGGLDDTGMAYVALPRASDEFRFDRGAYGWNGEPSLSESVSARFVRRPPVKVRGTKEEE